MPGMSSVEIKTVKFLDAHLWWIAPFVIIMPLMFISSNPVAPSAAYFGTTSIWHVIEKILDSL